MKKKLLSTILCLCMVVGMLPVIAPMVQASGTGVSDRLNQLREQYPHGQYWYRVNGVNSVTTTPCPHYDDLSACGYYNNGWQCWAFASKIFNEVFGQDPNISGGQRRDKENIQVGDYVRFTYEGNSIYGHSFLVIAKNGDTVTVVENNYGGNCRINWGTQYDLNAALPIPGVGNAYFDYYCHASNYDEINGSTTQQPDPTPTPTPSDPSYEFDAATGALTISGTKAISENSWPKNLSRDSVKSVIIKNGIPRIDDGALNYLSNLTSVLIPSSVTSIGDNAFFTCTNLTSISIPDSVTCIGHSVFSNCTNLTSINIPNSITSIGDYAFSNCKSLQNITIPGNVTSIGEWAFSGCEGLMNITISNGVKSIGDWAFGECSKLENITTPSSVTFMGDCVFEGCSNLTNVTILGTPVLGDVIFNKCDNIKNITLPATTFSSHSLCHFGWDFSDTHIKITGPGAIPDMPRQSGISVSSIELGNGITRIGDYAFWNSKFSNIAIPKSVTTIGEYAFGSCENLTSITIPSGVIEIEDHAFDGCRNLENITIPSSITHVGKLVFDSCYNLKSLTIPKDITAELLKSITRSRYEGEKFDFTWDFNYIYYGGNESDWKAIYRDNDHYLDNVTIHFNSTGPDTPIPPVSLKETIQQLIAGGLKKVFGVVSIHCPVDAEVYIEKQLVGKITNNVASDVVADKVYIGVEDDAKYIYFLSNDEFTVRMTATGEGTMEYTAQNLDVPSWTTLDSKYFRKVSLTSGKKMVSYVNYLDEEEKVDVPNVQLYVLDENGDEVKKVLPDDNGTEVPINTPMVTFDTTVATITITPMVVNENGKLPNLPAPARDDYTFDGWYKSDGTKVTTDTVFDSDTTVTAKWTKKTPTNPGGSTYNPGGPYIPPTYSITLPTVTGGKVSVSPASASSGSTVTVTTTPDAGYELTSLSVLGADGKTLALTDKGNGQYSFKMPSGKVTINAEFRPVTTGDLFTDVTPDDYYYDAVQWAVYNGITDGLTSTTFGPGKNATRAQTVTFLWRLAGKPEPASATNPFTDVDPISGSWYYKAMLWAAENKITTGKTSTTFDPGGIVTRAQFVTFLYRYAKPTSSTGDNPFTDVDMATGDWYYDAVLWAAENGITTGATTTTFAPSNDCVRYQIVLFLYRYSNK